jgi:transposase
MIDRTTLLFALPGFRVLNVTVAPDGGRQVFVESVAVEGGCPSCGVMSSRVKGRPVCRLKDLPHGSVPLRLWVCKRRFVCTEWAAPHLPDRLIGGFYAAVCRFKYPL